LRSGPTPRMSGKNDLFEKCIYPLHTRHHHTLCADEYNLCTQDTIILLLTFGESMTVREGWRLTPHGSMACVCLSPCACMCVFVHLHACMCVRRCIYIHVGPKCHEQVSWTSVINKNTPSTPRHTFITQTYIYYTQTHWNHIIFFFSVSR